jgi:hypothetical protein
MNSLPAEGSARRMLPWALVVLLATTVGIVLYEHFDIAISLAYTDQQLEQVTNERDTMKLLIDSHSTSFTRETIAQFLKAHPKVTSFPKDDDTVIVINTVALKLDGARLIRVEPFD